MGGEQKKEEEEVRVDALLRKRTEISAGRKLILDMSKNTPGSLDKCGYLHTANRADSQLKFT